MRKESPNSFILLALVAFACFSAGPAQPQPLFDDLNKSANQCNQLGATSRSADQLGDDDRSADGQPQATAEAEEEAVNYEEIYWQGLTAEEVEDLAYLGLDYEELGCLCLACRSGFDVYEDTPNFDNFSALICPHALGGDLNALKGDLHNVKGILGSALIGNGAAIACPDADDAVWTGNARQAASCASNAGMHGIVDTEKFSFAKFCKILDNDLSPGTTPGTDPDISPRPVQPPAPVDDGKSTGEWLWETLLNLIDGVKKRVSGFIEWAKDIVFLLKSDIRTIKEKGLEQVVADQANWVMDDMANCIGMSYVVQHAYQGVEFIRDCSDHCDPIRELSWALVRSGHGKRKIYGASSFRDMCERCPEMEPRLKILMELSRLNRYRLEDMKTIRDTSAHGLTQTTVYRIARRAANDMPSMLSYSIHVVLGYKVLVFNKKSVIYVYDCNYIYRNSNDHRRTILLYSHVDKSGKGEYFQRIPRQYENLYDGLITCCVCVDKWPSTAQ